MTDASHEPICRGKSYRKDQFFVRSGMGEAGFRTAKRNGLVTFTAAGRCYVTGDAWLDFLATQATGKAESELATD